MHPFDGHGLLRQISFKEGKAIAHAKFIRSKQFIREKKNDFKELTARGIASGYGTNWFANAKILFSIGSNPGNTAVVDWHGEVLAIYEGGHPYKMNPYTLKTLGTTDLNGRIHSNAFCLAHMKVFGDVMVAAEIFQGFNVSLKFIEFGKHFVMQNEYSYTAAGGKAVSSKSN